MAWKDILSIIGFGDGSGGTTVVDADNPLPMNDASVLAALVNRYGGGKTPVTTTLTTTSPVTLYAPSGVDGDLYWISAVNKTPQVSFPTVIVKIDGTEYYRVSAMSHWEKFPVLDGEELTVELDEAGTVDVTAHVKDRP